MAAVWCVLQVSKLWGLKTAWLSEGGNVISCSDRVQPQSLGRNLLPQLQALPAQAMEIKLFEALVQNQVRRVRLS